MTVDNRVADLIGALVLAALVFATWSIYAIGRNSGFIFDDFAHLPLLGITSQGVDGILRYAFSGGFGTPDRGLSKLSFMLDYTQWPAHPLRFKQTNILIHILVGVLVVWFFLRLMRLMKHPERVCLFVALAAGALWLLHPLNVSTTLYVVQRMTQLAALFVLAGMLCYLKGRELLADRPARGYAWMTAGLVGGAVLGYFGKENGALLPLFALTAELVLLRGLPAPPGFRYWRTIFLYAPAAALAAWLIYSIPRFMTAERAFSMGERLMSQARALVDYLRLILVPTRQGTGVFHDDFAISRGLLDPPTTLLSVGLVGGLLYLAVACRRRLPVLSFGIAWFFAGHILESTVVPLELYFEHRNYVPMLGPIFALCYYAVTATRLTALMRTSLVALICLAAMATWFNVRVWSERALNLHTWMIEHPTSTRVLSYAAMRFIQFRDYDASERATRSILALNPDLAYPKITLIYLSCLSGTDRTDAGVADIIGSIGDDEHDRVSSQLIDQIIKLTRRKPCEILTLEDIERITTAFINNPNFGKFGASLANFHGLRGRNHLSLGNLEQAALDFNKTNKYRSNFYTAVTEAGLWDSLGEHEKALEALRKARSTYRVSIHGFRYEYESDELDKWESALEKNILKKGMEQPPAEDAVE